MTKYSVSVTTQSFDERIKFTQTLVLNQPSVHEATLKALKMMTSQGLLVDGIETKLAPGHTVTVSEAN